MKVRVVNTASNAHAVQVVRYQNNKRVIVRHFGSAHSKQELDELLLVANEWINNFAGQLSIFPDDNPNQLLHINHCTFIGIYYNFFYDLLEWIQNELYFDDLPPLLKDLVSIRVFEPASKHRSLELLDQYFGIKHHRKNYYKIAPHCLTLKDEVEEKVVRYAKKTYDFNFDILFYDVTTLYFETFTEDELRKNGFSKDNKSQQPQILVALMVTKDGFPIAYEVFSGNIFEGHTIIPVVKEFIKKNRVKEFTIVADAAMISSDNIKELKENGINYIVGARLGNISDELFEAIDKSILRKNGKSIRIKTTYGYLICSFSSIRYRKDKYEMEKQIQKANQAVENPSKNKKLKFTKSTGQRVEINEKLI